MFKVSKSAKIRNRYNQVPHLTQDTNGKVTNSGVVRCQSQHQCHFWLMKSMFQARASELGSCQLNLCLSWGYEQLQNSKDSLKACFENVNSVVRIKISILLSIMWHVNVSCNVCGALINGVLFSYGSVLATFKDQIENNLIGEYVNEGVTYKCIMQCQWCFNYRVWWFFSVMDQC